MTYTRVTLRSIDDIDRRHLDEFEGSRLDFSYGLLRAMERSLWGDLRVDYLVVEQAGRPVAFTPVYTGTNVNINALLPTAVQRGFNGVVKWIGSAAKTRFAIAGSLNSDKGWIPMRAEAASEALVLEMTRFIDEFARDQKVKVAMIKDIHCDFPKSYTQQLERVGFTALYSLPTVVLDVAEFDSFAAYGKSLKKNARKHFNKVMRAAHERYVFERVDDYAHLLDEILPLFRAVFLKAKYKFDESIPAFFREAAASRSPKTELVLCKKGQRIVGALINFFDATEQLNKRIGMDYAEPDTPLIYTSLMYEGVRSAIEKRKRRVYLGQSTYLPKLRMGGRPEDVFFYVKAYDKVLGLTVPWQRKLSLGYRASRVEELALTGVSV